MGPTRPWTRYSRRQRPWLCLQGPCKPLQSFDISYVDEATHTYLLADRSNAAIDVFDTLTNTFVKFLQPTDPFAGNQRVRGDRLWS